MLLSWLSYDRLLQSALEGLFVYYGERASKEGLMNLTETEKEEGFEK